ncbi:MAG: thioredoxin family protein [Candidatus Marinimicrobia bacterium]|nr:thioredoxin family protein [Candidatus Neomarinimicrobiota bacterium]
MPVFNDSNREKIQDFLNDMKNDVTIVFFTQEMECEACSQTRQFVTELSELHNKLNLKIYDFVKDEEKAKELGLEQIPAITLLTQENRATGIKFYGLPGGYEINSFLTALVEVSGNQKTLNKDLQSRINKINKNIDIKIFVTLSCPYCPNAVIDAHRLALDNKNISAAMIESSTFPHLANKYNVTGVPKVIINDKEELTGAQPLEKILDAIDKI